MAVTASDPQTGKSNSLSALLRAKRLEKGLSLEKVRDATKITTKFLIALEEGNYRIFPAWVYLRGFFLTYAKYLGFPNAFELWEQLQAEEDMSFFDKHDNRDQARFKTAREASRSSRRPDGTLAAGPGKRPRFVEIFIMWAASGQNWILAFVVFPTLLVASFYFLYSYERYRAYRRSPESVLPLSRLLGREDKDQSLSAASGAPRPAGNVGGAVNPGGAESAASFAGNIFSLEIRSVSEPTWVQIDIDGKLAFQGVLPAGQQRSYQIYKIASLRIGNPRTLSLFVNGVPWSYTKEELMAAPLELDLTAQLIQKRAQ